MQVTGQRLRGLVQRPYTELSDAGKERLPSTTQSRDGQSHAYLTSGTQMSHLLRPITHENMLVQKTAISQRALSNFQASYSQQEQMQSMQLISKQLALNQAINAEVSTQQAGPALLKPVDFNSNIIDKTTSGGGVAGGSATRVSSMPSQSAFNSVSLSKTPRLGLQQIRATSRLDPEGQELGRDQPFGGHRSSWVSPLEMRKNTHRKLRKAQKQGRNGQVGAGFKSVEQMPAQAVLSLAEPSQKLTNIQTEHTINDPNASRVKYYSEVYVQRENPSKTALKFRRRNRLAAEGGVKKKTDALVIDKVIGETPGPKDGFHKHQASGLRPTTKVLVHHPNPRFCFESKHQNRPATAYFNLDKQQSEARLPNQTLGGQRELLRNFGQEALGDNQQQPVSAKPSPQI